MPERATPAVFSCRISEGVRVDDTTVRVLELGDAHVLLIVDGPQGNRRVQRAAGQVIAIGDVVVAVGTIGAEGKRAVDLRIAAPPDVTLVRIKREEGESVNAA